ncbi:RxLR-like protein [Plasmopara halstedii]|uniref:RxLR-like protein n=1 Tax=Plasmopara halstedii TaxID=4781 RepID=A0A0P1ASM8_PLAHL|nr:RxLR-like protein [Plasmopara halstedii]CEG44311.1 RxLR-like protein [Plasmopara halstedii]|eukprot:XP_024580680.1 RxLR-like protein [Plasmopara halstedii]
MRTFLILVLLAATLVVNDAVLSTTADNDTQATTFSLRTNSLEDAQKEERVGSSSSSSYSKLTAVERKWKANLSSTALEEHGELNKNNQAYMFPFLYTLKENGVTLDEVLKLVDHNLDAVTVSNLQKYQEVVEETNHGVVVSTNRSQLAKAFAKTIKEEQKPLWKKLFFK